MAFTVPTEERICDVVWETVVDLMVGEANASTETAYHYADKMKEAMQKVFNEERA